MVGIDMRADLTGLQRALFTFHADQVPFAAALSLTALAKDVAKAESLQVDETFDSPTEFTEQAFAVRPATKRNLVAFVSVKKIAATYLRPYVQRRRSFSRKGVKKGMIVPKNIGLDGHGNLPRGTLRSLQRRPDVFVGKVKSKDGTTVRVWQRRWHGRVDVSRSARQVAWHRGTIRT
jgi:hypothetical protein